jgi:polar amino acid transport system substrate-binding protein
MLKKFFVPIVILLLVIIAGRGVFLNDTQHPSTQVAETALQRILRTKTIRCGYVVNAPYLIKNPNTGEFSGVAFDFMQAIAEELNVRLEWVEEVGWGTFQEGLNGNRYDAMCVPVWQSGSRAQVALLSKPLYYNALYATTRADNTRFDGDFDTINKPDVRVAVIDGDATQAVRKLRFPMAQEVANPQLSDESGLMLNIATQKADVGLQAIDGLKRYNQSAAVKLKLALNGKPVRYFASTLAVKIGEHDLKAALDATIEALINSGQASQLVEKYESILLQAKQ